MSEMLSRVIDVFRDFAEDDLRDVWVFDHEDYDNLFVRDDIAVALDSVDVSRFVDNERFGYVTRDTYEALYYADYAYTVRGFDTFEQFRTFVGDKPIGLFAGFDRGASGRDFAALNDRLQAVADEFDVSELLDDSETDN
ncbi:hypothetical protein C440_11946 [Haloferax mucosum ATCC BAA-1512]|uniref:Uncharacterized protein n=1 Tax=Haloferax mucosum ATCC BAA-1512 TaxID=662479 RepID=M0I8B8_9EURY|nr:hypothetical protein [Haloferax mucosum]ELZ93011.1 hypothetical protein C440_11946 [Haloferax mucosum ATCC BAA-1512]